jgi:hypothetical protein
MPSLLAGHDPGVMAGVFVSFAFPSRPETDGSRNLRVPFVMMQRLRSPFAIMRVFSLQGSTPKGRFFAPASVIIV